MQKKRVSEMEQKKLRSKEVFNPKVIKKGIIVFISISLITLVGIFLYSNTSETINAWKQVNVGYLFLGLLFIFVDLYVGGLRNHIFIRHQ